VVELVPVQGQQGVALDGWVGGLVVARVEIPSVEIGT
jgi:hypothetical protein